MQNPLSDPQTSKPDERLVGVWRWKNEDDSVIYYHVGHAGDKFPDSILRVAFVRHVEGKVESPGESWMFPTVLGEKNYLNGIDKKGQRDKPPEERGWRTETVDSYYILKYQLDGDGLLVWEMNADAKKQAIKDGQIKGVIEPNKPAMFTDTTENLARFVAEAGDSLFSKEPIRLERVDAGERP